MKQKLILATILLLSFAKIVPTGETITILTPADNSTVSGTNLAITGIASVPFSLIRITINTTIVTKVTSNSGGNWNYTYPKLGNGNYTITAEIIDQYSGIIATDANSFTVDEPGITIISPVEDETLSTLLPAAITGTSTLASAVAQVLVDGDLVTTLSTDVFGNWQTSYPFLEDGQHTVVAQLLSGAPLSVIASDTKDFMSSNYLTLSPNVSKIRVVQGNIPTTGSGNGPGFSYSISGSTATITFVPVFSSAPTLIAVGQRSGDVSSVNISTISASSAVLLFSVSTERIHFQASLIL